MRNAVALGLAMVVVLTVYAVTLASPQNRPGEMTQARVWVENRNRGEAIPVNVHDDENGTPLRVRVMGNATVELARGTVVDVRQVRQAWEYRTTSVTVADMASALERLGIEGWETVAVTATNTSTTTLLLKRPR